MTFSADTQRLVAKIVELEVSRRGSVTMMMCADTIADDFARLIVKVKAAHLAPVGADMRAGYDDDCGFHQDIGADAGFMVGLELGRRLEQEKR